VDDRTRLAIATLLEKAEEAGIGIAFIPESGSWRIIHVGFEYATCDPDPDGDLACAKTLEEAAAEALLPLTQLAVEVERLV